MPIPILETCTGKNAAINRMAASNSVLLPYIPDCKTPAVFFTSNFGIVRLLLIFTLIFALSACKNEPQSPISADQTEKLLSENPEIQLIDLRTPEEVAQTGRIQGAVNINFNSEDFSSQLQKLNKSEPVIVYCAAGSRSGKAAASMKNMGFAKIYDYSGGMSDWKSLGKKTVP